MLGIATIILLISPMVEPVHQSHTRRVIVLPPAAKVSVAAVGEPLWQLKPVVTEETNSQTIRLENRIKIGNLMKGIVVIPQDSTLEERSIDSAFIACARLNMAWGRRHPCLLDADRDGAFEAVRFNDNDAFVPLDVPTRYNVASSTSARTTGPDFIQEIIYQGSNGQSIGLAYREYSEGMIRPGFSEKLDLPLSKTFPQKFRVKGIVFTVERIDGMGIEYEIDPTSPGLSVN